MNNQTFDSFWHRNQCGQSHGWGRCYDSSLGKILNTNLSYGTDSVLVNLRRIGLNNYLTLTFSLFPTYLVSIYVLQNEPLIDQATFNKSFQTFLPSFFSLSSLPSSECLYLATESGFVANYDKLALCQCYTRYNVLSYEYTLLSCCSLRWSVSNSKWAEVPITSLNPLDFYFLVHSIQRTRYLFLYI